MYMYFNVASSLTCVNLPGSVSHSMSQDLDAESVVAGHAVDAYVWRVPLTDVHRRSASTSLVVSRRATDDDRQHEHQVPSADAATT